MTENTQYEAYKNIALKLISKLEKIKSLGKAKTPTSDIVTQSVVDAVLSGLGDNFPELTAKLNSLHKYAFHYSDLTKYEKEFNQLNVVQGKRAIVSQFQQQLPGTQDIVQAKTSLNNALDDLLKSLDGSILHDVDSLKANIIQNKSLSDAYLDQAKSYSDQAKSYSDQAAVYWEKSHKQGPQWVS